MPEQEAISLPRYDADSFRARFLGARRRPTTDEAEAAAKQVLAAVEQSGDAALLDYTRRFDGVELRQISFDAGEIAGRAALAPPELRAAIDVAAAEIEAYHRRQPVPEFSFTAPDGSVASLRQVPVDRAGIYVPGGLASYPSSVLMCAIPARVAGVGEVVACTPPTPSGDLNPIVAYAAQQAGVGRICLVGGAQAVAAMAVGTASVPKVDKIVGPGNAYVTAAKRLVFGMVSIDSLAGPSEVAIIADDTADPHWLALDLLAQAEHGPDTSAVILSADRDLLDAVGAAVAQAAASLARADLLVQSLASGGAAVEVTSVAEAAALVDELAPEHLMLWLRDANEWAARIRHAGALFIGPWSPVALGDYAAGPNHVLPTGGAAKFMAQLSIYDFLRPQSVYQGSAAAFSRLGPAAATIAQAEGLDAHAASLLIRLQGAGEAV